MGKGARGGGFSPGGGAGGVATGLGGQTISKPQRTQGTPGGGGNPNAWKEDTRANKVKLPPMYANETPGYRGGGGRMGPVSGGGTMGAVNRATGAAQNRLGGGGPSPPSMPPSVPSMGRGGGVVPGMPPQALMGHTGGSRASIVGTPQGQGISAGGNIYGGGIAPDQQIMQDYIRQLLMGGQLGFGSGMGGGRF